MRGKEGERGAERKRGGGGGERGQNARGSHERGYGPTREPPPLLGRKKHKLVGRKKKEDCFAPKREQEDNKIVVKLVF